VIALLLGLAAFTVAAIASHVLVESRRREVMRSALASGVIDAIDDQIDEDMVVAAEIARHYSISPGAVIKLAMRGAIPGRQIDGRWKFYPSRVIDAMERVR